MIPSELIGPKRNFAPVKAWFESWDYGTPDQYPLILIGDAGVGKSTIARCFAEASGFDVIESHAEEERDVDYFNTLFSEARMPTFFGQQRCCIIEDTSTIPKSGWRAFDKAIPSRAFPMVIIADSESAVAWRHRKSGLTHLLPAPTEAERRLLLVSICPDGSQGRLDWAAKNSSSWRSAELLFQTSPDDWVDSTTEASGRSRTGHAEIAAILAGEHPQSRSVASHPLGVIAAAEWNCAPPESVCEALRLHSLAWVVDGMSGVSMAYLTTLRAQTYDRPPFRRRDIRGATRWL